MRLAAALLALVLCAPLAAAQPRAGGPPGQAALNRREKVKKRIRALRAYTLTDELALDEATAGKLFPVLSKYDDEFDRLLGARAEIQNRLGGAGGMQNPKAIDKLIDEAIANQRAFWDAEAQRLGELRKILTPAQTARLLIVLPALEKKIQNQLQRAISNPGAGRPGARKPGNAKNPYDDDDDDEAPEPAPPPAPKPKPAPGAKPPCDPFSSIHC